MRTLHRLMQSTRLRLGLGIGCMVAVIGCGAPQQPGAAQPTATPEYDKQTGRLQALVGDKDGDGKPDTWARLDGARVHTVEIDENRDGKPDRWEHYGERALADGTPMIERAEEAGPDGRIVRREFYESGVIARVEEDTSGSGRPDKWEYYTGGELARVELDLQGKGFPDRRLVYRGSAVDRVEADPDGDGRFESLTSEGVKR